MPDVLTDLRYAWRRLRATPAFSVTAVLTLALGIGTATAVFGVVDALRSGRSPASTSTAHTR